MPYPLQLPLKGGESRTKDIQTNIMTRTTKTARKTQKAPFQVRKIRTANPRTARAFQRIHRKLIAMSLSFLVLVALGATAHVFGNLNNTAVQANELSTSIQAGQLRACVFGSLFCDKQELQEFEAKKVADEAEKNKTKLQKLEEQAAVADRYQKDAQKKANTAYDSYSGDEDTATDHANQGMAYQSQQEAFKAEEEAAQAALRRDQYKAQTSKADYSNSVKSQALKRDELYAARRELSKNPNDKALRQKVAQLDVENKKLTQEAAEKKLIAEESLSAQNKSQEKLSGIVGTGNGATGSAPAASDTLSQPPSQSQGAAAAAAGGRNQPQAPCEGLGLGPIKSISLGTPVGKFNFGDCAKSAKPTLDGPGAEAGLNKFATQYKGNTYSSAVGMLAGWTNFVLPFVSLLAIAAIIYAGFLYITALGNDEQVGKAKDIILWVVVGIVVILSAYAIVNTVLGGSAG